MTKIDRVVATCSKYYDDNICGGKLHIVLDDGNTEIGHVAFCYKEAILAGDKAGEYLALELMKLTEKERDIVWSRYDEYA